LNQATQAKGGKERTKSLALFYTMMKDHDHGSVESPQNKSKGRPMEIQKSFMCEHGLLSVK
jgi:hypothetical protein